MDPIQNKSISSSKRDRNIEFIGPDSDLFCRLSKCSGKESSVDFNGNGNRCCLHRASGESLFFRRDLSSFDGGQRCS